MEELFDKWYEENQRRFHCGQFDEKQIAYSAYLEGQNARPTPDSGIIWVGECDSNRCKQYGSGKITVTIPHMGVGEGEVEPCRECNDTGEIERQATLDEIKVSFKMLFEELGAKTSGGQLKIKEK